MTQQIEIGRLLRAGTTGFIAGCSVSQFTVPALGALTMAQPEGSGYKIYGMIYDIHIDDDGLVRQLVTSEHVTAEVMRDNRERRIVPVEMSVLAVGYEQDGKIRHLLPPRPPLSLDVIALCGDDEVRRFTSAGQFGYFRHILRNDEAPVGEVLAAHMTQAAAAHGANGAAWKEKAAQEIVTLLRDDYPKLMSVLGALREAA
ncbi:MAG: HAS-barrel domain-containing protein [Anaerolineales bacterium]